MYFIWLTDEMEIMRQRIKPLYLPSLWTIRTLWQELPWVSLHLSNNTSSSPFVVRILRCLHFYSTIIKHHIPVITFMRYCKRSFQVSECLKMVITVWNSWEQCKRPIPAGSDLPTVIGDLLTIIVICSLSLWYAHYVWSKLCTLSQIPLICMGQFVLGLLK